MLKTRGRKILRDITTRRARTALVSISIFIGVMGVVALFSMGEILTNSLQAGMAEDKLAMIRTYVAVKPDEPLDNAAVIDALENVPSLTDAQGMALYAAYWQKPGAAEFEEGRIFAYSHPFDEIPLEPVTLFSGRYPVEGQREIAVERRLAEVYGFSLGDAITLRILSSDSDTLVTEDWTIVGTVFQGYQYPVIPSAPSLIYGEMMLFANYNDAQHIAGFSGFNLILARYDDYANADPDVFERTLVENSPYTPVFSSREDPHANAFIAQIRSFSSVLGTLSIVALVVSGFLVFNVINAIIVEQRRQIGVMKSLGASGWDNFSIYAGIALIYGIIGVIPGVLIGVPFGFYAAKGLAPQFNIFIDQFDYSPGGIVLGATIGLLIPVFAALIPVMNGLRVSILEAMTDLGLTVAAGENFRVTAPGKPLMTAFLLLTLPFRVISRLLIFMFVGVPLWILLQLPLPLNTAQALRNLQFKQSRITLTIITLALAGGAFMGVYAMLSSLNTMTEDIFRTFGNDLTISPTAVQDFEHMQALLAKIEGIEQISPSTVIAAEIVGYEPKQLGAQTAALLTFGFETSDKDVVIFNLDSGNAWNDDPERRGVVINTGIAETMGKAVGDLLDVRAGNKTEAFEIIGITNYPTDTLWMRWEDLSALGGLVQGAPVANQYFTQVEIDGAQVAAAGINDFAVSALTFQDGDYQAAGVIISTPLAEKYSIGDTLTLTAGDNSLEAPITGIFDLPPTLATGSDEAIALDWQALAALEGRSLEGAPLSNSLSVMLDKPDPTTAEVDNVIAAVNEVLLDEGIPAAYTNWSQTKEYVSQLIVTSGVIMNTAAFLIAAVGAIGLLSTLSMSVFERQKEIGVMRSVGATSSTVAAQFLVEGLIVGLIAWAIGVPLGYGLNVQLSEALNFGDAVGSGYPLSAAVIGLVGMLLVVIFASLSPALAAARKTVSDILRYQ